MLPNSAPPPLIPVSAMNIMPPSTPSPTVSAGNGHISMKQSPTSTGTTSTPSPGAEQGRVHCRLCGRLLESQADLNDHMFKDHATENADLFKMFDLPLSPEDQGELNGTAHSPLNSPVQSPYVNGESPLDLTNGRNKRPLTEDEDNSDNTLPNGDATSSPPAKKQRRRKSRPFKNVKNENDDLVGEEVEENCEEVEEHPQNEVNGGDMIMFEPEPRHQSSDKENEEEMFSEENSRQSTPAPVNNIENGRESSGTVVAEDNSSCKRKYICQHCDMSFANLVLYTMHSGYHGFINPFQCNSCGTVCKDALEFHIHMARVAHAK